MDDFLLCIDISILILLGLSVTYDTVDLQILLSLAGDCRGEWQCPESVTQGSREGTDVAYSRNI